LFKEGDFAGAVKSYTESIKRDPNDPRGYNNRALAYTKLVALPEALKDAEEAIRVDPTFGKPQQLWRRRRSSQGCDYAGLILILTSQGTHPQGDRAVFAA